MLLTIERYRSVDALAHRLGIPVSTIQESLEKLAKIGLVIKKNSLWAPTQIDIHLPKDSALTGMNHTNWRNRAILDSYKGEAAGIHYTAVHSLARSDFEKIKEMVLAFLDQTRAVVRPSPEEELALHDHRLVPAVRLGAKKL